MGTPAAAATSRQKSLLPSSLAAARTRPHHGDAGRPQTIGEAADEGRLGADDDEVDGSRRTSANNPSVSVMPTGSTRATSVMPGLPGATTTSHPGVAIAGEPPAQGVLPAAGAHHEHSAVHRQAPAAAVVRRGPEATRPVRMMVWVRSGPTLTSVMGTPASSSSAST